MMSSSPNLPIYVYTSHKWTQQRYLPSTSIHPFIHPTKTNTPPKVSKPSLRNTPSQFPNANYQPEPPTPPKNKKKRKTNKQSFKTSHLSDTSIRNLVQHNTELHTYLYIENQSTNQSINTRSFSYFYFFYPSVAITYWLRIFHHSIIIVNSSPARPIWHGMAWYGMVWYGMGGTGILIMHGR